MSDRIIDTIRLSGKDSMKLVNNLFRPSYEYIQKNSRIMEYVENNIEIENLDNGFEASIADLDLSFLDKINSEKASEITIMSMMVMDYLDIIPGNYTCKLSFYTDNLYCYDITDNMVGNNFKLYINSESYGDSFIITDKDGNDLIENMKSTYDNDKEILKRIDALDKNDTNELSVNKDDEIEL